MRRVRDAPDGVGKSTIVTSLIKESFIPNVRLSIVPDQLVDLFHDLEY
jgi:GTPase SAR1 family protein